MNVIKGRSELKNQHTIHLDKVTTGSLVHVKTATISVVTAGAIVIADTITGLEKITAGAIVVAKYPTNPDAQNIEITNGGKLYNSLNSCIEDLQTQITETDDESKQNHLTEKLERIKHLQMWD